MFDGLIDGTISSLERSKLMLANYVMTDRSLITPELQRSIILKTKVIAQPKN
jgi:hypothetical protein